MTSSAVSVQLDVPARMRDGITLKADVYRPSSDGPWPTLLCRTPYGKHVLREIAWNGMDPIRAAADGFMVIIQDTRGRFSSGGRWQPLINERLDGFDTIEWAARLPGSNGHVGMFGGSYCGNTQWMPVFERPLALRGIAPMMTWRDPMDGLFSRGGALELGLLLPWSLLTGADDPAAVHRREHDDSDGRDIAAEFDQLGHSGYWELPSTGLAPLRRHGVADLGSVRALSDPAFADSCSVAELEPGTAPPSFSTGGWYDLFLQGTLDNYCRLAATDPDARLVVGPWAHEAFNPPIGDLPFGIGANRDGVPVHAEGDWHRTQLVWFRHVLDQRDAAQETSRVRLFVMGRNTWRDEATWPLARAVQQRWYLHADGGLRLRPPPLQAEKRLAEFTYDPASPVPTVGGSTLLTPDFRPGPADQSKVEARDDVIVFSSRPLPEDLEVTGRVRVTLHARSSAPSTDWVARLCDVHPDGRSINICDGITRIAADADRCRPIDIDLWSTSNVFLRGHRLRVAVTSSSFPRWDRNLNTGDQDATRSAVARQTVCCDAERASFLEIPVVPHG